MYDVVNETLFIQIPKNGSQTLKHIVKVNTNNYIDYGHIRYLNFTKNIKRVFAISRHPYERLLSSINYICDNEHHVDQVFNIIVNNKFNMNYVNNCLPTNIILRPQTYFLKNCSNCVSYKLENIDKMIYDLNWKYDNKRFNTSTYKFDIKFLKSHKMFFEAMKIYKDDFLFYQQSL